MANSTKRRFLVTQRRRHLTLDFCRVRMTVEGDGRRAAQNLPFIISNKEVSDYAVLE